MMPMDICLDMEVRKKGKGMFLKQSKETKQCVETKT